jgi:peptide-methionine (S)-S-oxide reductase
MNAPTSPVTRTQAALEVALLGGGCFWCLDAVFRELDGVTAVESGYAGGSVANPTYEDICTGRTGHAEVVRVTFDPSVLSFRDLLTVFFTIHDPTTLNRQGNDVGTQYRSVVFCQSEEQRATTQDVIASLDAEKLWSGPIVTEVISEMSGASTFHPAETYHQDYFEQNTNQPYCMFVVAPKVAKFRKAFAQRLKRTVA